MALPSGYKRLEYIQSSGTQYVNTGFVPDQDSRIVLSVYFPIQNSNQFLFGARNDSNGTSTMRSFSFNVFNTFYRSHYNSKWIDYSSSISFSEKFVVDKNKNVTKLNGENTITHTYAEFKSPVKLTLLAVNTNGTISGYAIAKLYSCKIYDNDVLIRDFIPCKKPDGTIGLWDDVNSVFYGNAGTGTFTAGPVVIAIPDSPSNLHQTMAVRLAWAAVSGAERYNVYRDGTLLATTTDLAYVDDTAAENTEYTYGVNAVNSAGESPKTTLTVYTKTGYFLYKPVVESATFQ